MDGNRIEHYLEELRNTRLPDHDSALEILNETEKILVKEPNLLEISGRVVVVGDLHGQFYDFLHMMELASSGDKLLFLGDYVDRGYNSVELIFYLFLLKLREPSQIFLLRGNHENRAQTSVYGFASECLSKYNYLIYWRVCRIFTYLAMAALVNESYFCIHGGITPGLTLDLIRNSTRMKEFSPEIGPILWSDPSEEIEYFQESQRGAGFLFGNLALDEFLASIKCKYLLRSHQLVFDGILESFDGKCITVWSAPNYCYKCNNLAAVVLIDNLAHKYLFFDAVAEQYKN